jgi:hypothetical protein
MGVVLFEGDWQNPGISPATAKDVVLSDEAVRRLYELFPPKLDRAPRIRRPGNDQPERRGSDLRRKPSIPQ